MKKKNGANDRIRTDDLLITNELLYRLSYIGLSACKVYTIIPFSKNATSFFNFLPRK